MAQSTQSSFEFHRLQQRDVIARFDGGDITTDAGGLLLREVDNRLDLTARLTACFADHRRPDKIEHTVQHLVAQRIYGLALGYEDLNDHDELRADPMMAVLTGKRNRKGPTGADSRTWARPAPARALSIGWNSHLPTPTPRHATRRSFMTRRIPPAKGAEARPRSP